jgi:hypothetical protein
MRMNILTTEWNIYRTRFLVKAKQLTQPIFFIDTLGRDHQGRAGDYLVEWSDGSRRVAPRKIFEDIYVPMGPASSEWPASKGEQLGQLRRRPASRAPAAA